VGYLDADQLDWLASDLSLVPPGATVVVSLHIPLESSMSARTGEPDSRIVQTVNNREALYRLLEPYQAHVLAGHTHELEHRTQGKLREHIHGTVCGAWWSGEIGNRSLGSDGYSGERLGLGSGLEGCVV